MRKAVALVMLLLFCVTAAAQTRPTTAGTSPPLPAAFDNPVYPGYLADPQCICVDGVYYAVGTGRGETTAEHRPDRVVPMIRSTDLQHWTDVGPVLIPPVADPHAMYWAPEVARDGDRFYLYYATDAGGPAGGGMGFRLRVATSRSPTGPYTDTGTPLTDPAATAGFAIDPHPFRDDDGKWYLFYATDHYDSDATTVPPTFRGTALAMDELTTMTRLAGRPETVMRAHWPWQLYKRNRLMGGVRGDWYTLEGPTVVKHAGTYYCFYSGGNFQNDTYGLDYLTAPTVHGPWTEAGRDRGPQVMRSVPGQVIGPGHNGVVHAPDGRDYILYHAWDATMTARQLWVDPIDWTSGGPRVTRFVGRIDEMNRRVGRAATTRP